MATKKNIRVMVVEDDAGVRHSLELLLQSTAGLECNGSAGTVSEALRVVPEAKPDVVLLDINLPDGSGIECAAAIKERLPNTQIIMITVYDDTEKVFQSLRAGASGYILKRATPKKILDAIHEVVAGGVPMSNEIARKVLNFFHQTASQAKAEEINLTPRETEVLTLLATGGSNKEIAARLSVTAEAVSFHLRHIYSKLHVRSRTEAALKYREMRGGLIQGSPTPKI